jgi:hypothetical protein
MKRTIAVAAAVLVAAVAAAVVHAAGPSLHPRLLKSGDLVGFNPDPATTYNAFDWAAKEGPGDLTAEQQWLERAGFVAGASEQLSTPQVTSQTALSFVIEFRTAAGAQADLARELARQKKSAPAGAKLHSFRVFGIPGAHGLAMNGELGIAGCGCGTIKVGTSYEVFFEHGQFFYGVVGYSPANGQPPSSTQVTQAALRLSHRAHSTT